jgi:hypothetical protein
MTHITLVLTIAAVLSTAGAGLAEAQDSWDSVVVRSGALLSQVGSTVRIDPRLGSLGTSIDLEDDLGFSSEATTFFSEGTWRLSRRSQLQISYNNVRRDVSNVLLDRPVTFGNTTVNAQARVDSFLDTWYLTANYGLAIVATPRAELGVMAGVTALRIHTGLGLSAQVGAAATHSRQLTENAQFTVPIPLPGLFLNLRPHDRVTLSASARYLHVSIGDFSGGMTEASAGGDVKLLRWLGVGGAYYYNRVDADHAGNVFTGRIAYQFNGPQAYVVLAF